MTAADARAFPSETGWLLALLGATVLTNAWFVADRLAEPSGDEWIYLVMLLAPGPGLYFYYARWRLRRARPLAGPVVDPAARTVAGLAAEAGVTEKLQVRTDAGLGARAYVAGLADRPYLVLGPELVASHRMGGTRRAVFEAVVRHELAHLRGGDLRWYQVATALRFTNVYAALWILLVLSVGAGSAGQLVVTALRAAALVVLAEATFRAFLRVREHHADLAAATGGAGVLDGLLAALGDRDGRVAVSRSWLRRHPGTGRRRAALVEPGVLLASAPGQVLLGATMAGVLLTTALDRVEGARTAEPGEGTATVGLLVGIPLALFVALIVWRSVWHRALAGGRSPVPACAAALFAGLVLGSHLSPYSQSWEPGSTGISADPWLMPAVAVAAAGLCYWQAALAGARVRRDPTTAFLTGAGGCVVVVGGWAFAVLSTWTARLLGVRLDCDDPEDSAIALCRSADPSTDVARSVGAEFAFTPYSLIAVAVVAGSLLVAGLRPRRPVTVASAVAVALVATGGLWWAGRAPGVQPVDLAVRPVLEVAPVTTSASSGGGAVPPAERQSTDPEVQRRALAAFRCSVDDPLLGAADPMLPLVTCAANGSEKYLLGPVELGEDDVAGAEAGVSGALEPQVTLTFTSAARWEEFTAGNVDGRIAVLVDDVVLVAPTIMEPLRDGTAVISGGLTRDEATDLADRIGGG